MTSRKSPIEAEYTSRIAATDFVAGDPVVMSKKTELELHREAFDNKPSPDRRAAIARLVQRGVMKYEKPGQYFPEEVSEEVREDFPKYDVQALMKAFPEILEIEFDEAVDDDTGESKGMDLILYDGKGADVRIPIGKVPPASTDKLIELMRSHYRSQFNLSNIEETAAVFQGFDDDD